MAGPRSTFLSSETQRPLVIFPLDLQKQITNLMRDKTNPLANAFDRLIRNDSETPLGIRLGAGGVFWLKANHSGRDSLGVMYIKTIGKDDPLVVVGILPYGDFVKAAKNRKVRQEIATEAEKIMANYYAEKAEKADKYQGKDKLPQGFGGYQPHIGLM